ncbi:NnrS family protein [Paraglaciecola sp.]|uniref:NnrS family protein n=1 Tax=Paraglaciecola sp. TaxID=1920173 RepID=UPI003EF94A91
MQISDPNTEHKIPAIWRQAFRPMFLFGSLFAILCVTVWAFFLSGYPTISPYGGMMFWHSHEMLFGFVAAILVGFLLTAVQNWTGLRATHGKKLAGLFSLWLIARIFNATQVIDPPWILLIIDISFLLVSAFFMAQLVLKVKQYRNLIFVPVLILFASTNLLSHLSVLLNKPELSEWGNYAAVFIITLVMSLIAGRIFPMFTANGTQTAKVPVLPWLESLVIGSSILLTLNHLSFLQYKLPNLVMAVLFAVASTSHVIRAIRWRPHVTLGTPLVWSLHGAYWFIPISLAMFACYYVGLPISQSSALHGLTAGAISSLVLAMLARISLGHTGRQLKPHKLISFAFAMIITAAVIRVFGEFVQVHIPYNLYIIAAGLWALAYAVFVLTYWKILTSPRPDGRPG